MSKIGVRLNIDVTKLQKEHFFKGKKGTYCEMVVFIDPNNADDYGQHGGIKQTWKDCNEKEQGFIGNAKVFWQENSGAQGSATPAKTQDDWGDDSDLPF